MYKLNSNSKIIKFLTYVPPVFGIIVFTSIVKLLDNDLIALRLPYYQGLMSFYSLFYMGFTYVTNRYAILGKKMLFFLTLIYLIPTIIYSNTGMDVMVVVLLSLIFFINSCIQYLLLLKEKLIYYILFTALNSTVLPITLILNLFYLIVLTFMLIILFIYVYVNVNKSLSYFVYTQNGLDIIKSIFIHSPFLIFPFFDYKIQEIIGVLSYGNYVLFYKYINGSITILFSYSQLSLLFKGGLKRSNLILKILMIIFFLIIIMVSFKNNVIFIILLMLYSFGVNLSSLLLRNKLINGIQFSQSLLGLLFLSFYVISLNSFRNYISLNINLFVLLMFLSMVFPCLLLVVNFVRNENKG